MDIKYCLSLLYLLKSHNFTKKVTLQKIELLSCKIFYKHLQYVLETKEDCLRMLPASTFKVRIDGCGSRRILQVMSILHNEEEDIVIHKMTAAQVTLYESVVRMKLS